jgi:hypothetical protein
VNRWLLCGVLLGPGWPGQDATLAATAQAARQAWLAHDVAALVARSSGVILQIPGADPSSPVGRAQAGELLRRYLGAAEEVAIRVVTVREVEPGKGFVEMDRRYVVRGTADERRETVFLGFRRVGVRWVLSEVRSVGG